MITCKESESQCFLLQKSQLKIKEKIKQKLIENATMWNFAGISDEDIWAGESQGGVDGGGGWRVTCTVRLGTI